MSEKATRPDSQAVKELQSDPVAIAALLDLCGLACVSVLASRVAQLESDLKRVEHDNAKLKEKVLYIESERDKLMENLKKRFAKIDKEIEALGVPRP